MRKRIKLFDPHTDVNEEKIIKKVLHSHYWASGAGTNLVLKFENLFKKYLGTKSCVAVNSGTAALHLALSLFDIKNKEVILPSLSFVTTAHAVIYNGGVPRFADVSEEDLCMDPSSVEEVIDRRSTVILPVHFAGMPAKISQIRKMCSQNDLGMVEDAAHAAGANFHNKRIGTHGDAVCFSFHPVKNLAMPTGGAITLNNNKHLKSQEKDVRSKRWCGIIDRNETKYDVDRLGWNYYMNEFSAAIGIEQLKKLDRMNVKRQKIAKRYSQEILINEKMRYSKDCSYHIFWIRVKSRDKFMKEMTREGIETGIHYRPIHKMSYYNKKISLPVTEKISREIVSIPVHPNLSEDDVSRVIRLVNKFS